jgi:hypothetical protein
MQISIYIVFVTGNESSWPSTKISRESVVEHVYFIWNKFLSDSAPSQICVPSLVLLRTKYRLENLHLYGSEGLFIITDIL